MSAAADQLAELDQLIAAGHAVDPREYVEAETAARIEQRVAEASDRIAEQQEAANLKMLRLRHIEDCQEALPYILDTMSAKIDAAVEGVSDEPGYLSPQALRVQLANIRTLSTVLLEALEAGGAPSGSTPARDLLHALRWLRDDFGPRWAGRLDLNEEIAAAESFVMQLTEEF